jgi:OTU-like cysteine protease
MLNPHSVSIPVLLQFRSVSFGLYGTEDYHKIVRRRAVTWMADHKEHFQAFLGEDHDEYMREMAEPYTWGDELTLVSQQLTQLLHLQEATFHW